MKMKISEMLDKCNNSFEKVSILRQSTLSFGNNAIGLINLLEQAEVHKQEQEEKEKLLGLQKEDKPFGEIEHDKVQNNVLVYKTVNHNTEIIQEFIETLEVYTNITDEETKYSVFEKANQYAIELRKKGIEPKQFIISPHRKEIWKMIDENYFLYKKKFEIHFFIQKIKSTRIQYQVEINGIKNYYKTKQENIQKIIEARVEEKEEKEIIRLQKLIDKKLDMNIEPLLKETQLLLKDSRLDIDSLPTELNEEQEKEFQAFVPAISEYCNDQCYALSGGYGYTELDKNLKKLQETIDAQKNLSLILTHASELGDTIQHLYILHWISENMLKDILNYIRAMMGTLITRYDKKYPDSKTDLNKIKTAVYTRNDIAHNGLIWDQKKIPDAIKEYKTYILFVASEQKIDMHKYVIEKQNREISEKTKQEINEKFLREKFSEKEREILVKETKLFKEVERKCLKENWKLKTEFINNIKSQVEVIEKFASCLIRCFDTSEDELKEISNSIYNALKRDLIDREFVVDDSFIETYQKKIQYPKRDYISLKKIGLKYKDVIAKLDDDEVLIKSFTWAIHNQKDFDAQKKLDEIKQRIEAA